MRRLAGLAMCLAIATAPDGLAAYTWGDIRAPAASLLVQVVEVGTRRPLPNADVFDVSSGTHRLTNARGEARLEWPQAGVLHLRVRQLGYRFVDRELRASGAVADTVIVVLERVAFVLPELQEPVQFRQHLTVGSGSRHVADESEVLLEKVRV